MLRRTSLSMFVITVVTFALAFPLLTFSQTGGHSRALITQRIDDAKLITLAGNTHPEATAANDRGIVADDLQLDHMLLQLRRPAEQQQALDKYVNDLTDLHSPNYHQWLTAKDFGEKYGLAAPDLTAITSWLESHGFTVNGVFTNNSLIDFSGTAGQVRQAFHTEIHNLDVDGVKHIANMSDPKIPAALAEAVVGIISLHDFMPHPMYKPKTNYTLGGGEFAVVPADLATIYNLNPLFTEGVSGQGQTVVVIEDTNVFKMTDWNTFRTTFGLSTFTSGSFTLIHPTGPNNCANPGVNGAEGEAILDAEYASAAAPSAAIEMASCADTATTFGGLIAVENLVNTTPAPSIMSISYGVCEANTGAAGNAAFSAAYEQAASESASVFVAAGDEGAASCDADQSKSTHGIGITGWGGTPYNVAVGGTDFGDTFAKTTGTYWNTTNTATFGSAKSYIPEIPWNDSCASQLLTTFEGSTVPYGTSGFCNSTIGKEGFLTTASGSGGQSGCATGKPSVSGVVGGTCAGYAKPSWQTGVIGIPSDGVRDIPDVSLFAANGVWGHFFLFCDSDGGGCTGTPNNWDGAGGTSFASPILAGMQALVNQKTGSSQGNPNPTYYSLAATEYGTTGSTSCNSSLGNAVGTGCIFYDVTQGDMDVNCTGTNNCYNPGGTNGVLSTSNAAYQPAYVTGTGWDFATGIGTVNAFNLVNAWPVSTSPSFTLAASPNSVSIAQGANGTSTITITPKNGFSGSVTLTASGLPSGVTPTFSPIVSNQSTLTLAVGTGVAPGTVTVTVTGTSNTLMASTTISLTVTSSSSGNFSLSASPTSLTINKGSSGKSAITVTDTGGFTGTVTFSASGQPSGVTATFSPASATKSAHLLLTVGSSVASGTYPMTISGMSEGLTNTTPFTLIVAGGSGGGSFTLTAAPTSVTLTPGGAGGTSTITVVPAGGFTGVVTFTTSTLPTGVTASFSPIVNNASTLTLTATSGATAGKSAVTITGTSGTLTATVMLKLAVQ
jgi:subtilase family serine protease